MHSIQDTLVDNDTFHPMLKNLLFCSAASNNEAVLMDLGQKQVLPALKVIKPVKSLSAIHDVASLILANRFIYIIPCFRQVDCG